MQTYSVWKFPLEDREQQTVLMPDGAKILSAQVQRGRICVWALCDPEAPKSGRQIYVFGTGYSIPEHERMEFLGTVQLLSGDLVLHIFEKR